MNISATLYLVDSALCIGWNTNNCSVYLIFKDIFTYNWKEPHKDIEGGQEVVHGSQDGC